MTIRVSHVRDVAVISLAGNLLGEPDITELRSAVYDLLSAGERKFVLEMRNVKRINSSGLGTMIAILTSVRNKDGQLCLAQVSENVSGLLMMTRLARVFRTYETVSRAAHSF